jgi:acylaminoacyl-peptidase
MKLSNGLAAAAVALMGAAWAEEARQPSRHFETADVFRLEYADDPQISPSGDAVAYVRVSADIMVDRFRPAIWMVDANGRNHRPLVQGRGAYSSPVWAPGGDAIAYVASEQGATELRIVYLDTREQASVARLPSAPRNLAWSPDGRTLAFQMFVEEKGAEPAALPRKPEGAQWAPPARVIDRLVYRADGAGYLRQGFTQIFVVPADGGTPRQLTFAARNHDGRMTWTRDGRRLVFSANAEEGWEFDPLESDLYSLDIVDRAMTRLTTRDGPEDSPALSPDGRRLAYVGFDDRVQGYQVTELYVADADGSNPRSLTASLDRDVRNPKWGGADSIYFLYEDRGVTKLGRVSANGGRMATLLENIGGTGLGRPYTSGAYDVNMRGRWTATITTPLRPADIVAGGSGAVRDLTQLNADLFAAKTLSPARELIARSSADGREIQAWIVRPPDFDPSKRYPLLLEIHGGPFAAYGPVFSAEVQLFAAAGYIVVYANPRGSTSYGGAFGNLIHHAYPSQDYDDLMSVVDAAIAREPVDPKKLYVTGGSGGGVLTAWIVGSTNRFAGAMVQKPIVNWTSAALTTDIYTFMPRYWFASPPWEGQEAYWARSPLSRVGNVTTPTAVMVGEEDYRTPTAEAEQFYQALRLRRIPTRMIRIPGAPHDIAARPSGMIAKVVNTVAWFAEHGGPPATRQNTGAAPAAGEGRGS